MRSKALRCFFFWSLPRFWLEGLVSSYSTLSLDEDIKPIFYSVISWYSTLLMTEKSKLSQGFLKWKDTSLMFNFRTLCMPVSLEACGTHCNHWLKSNIKNYQVHQEKQTPPQPELTTAHRGEKTTEVTSRWEWYVRMTQGKGIYFHERFFFFSDCSNTDQFCNL